MGTLPITDKTKAKAIEHIRAIAEELIWSDQHNASFSAYVTETNLFRLFWNILCEARVKEIQVQLIQSATLLIHNLTSDSFKSTSQTEYLLATMFYKEIVLSTFDFSDEDVVENYMSMLKAFAVNLKPELLSDFLCRTNFALLTGTVTFMNYRDVMIKTAARTVMLRILSCDVYVVKPENIKEYIVNSGLFSCFVSMMGEKLLECSRAIAARNGNYFESSFAALIEDLYYINDIYELSISEFEDILIGLLLKIIVFPVAVRALGCVGQRPDCISVSLAAVFLQYAIRVIKSPVLVNAVAVGLFVRQVPVEIVLLVEGKSSTVALNDVFRLQLASFLEHLAGSGNYNDLTPNPAPAAVFSLFMSKDMDVVGAVLMLVYTLISSSNANNGVLLTAGIIPFDRIQQKKGNYKKKNLTYNDFVVEAILEMLNKEEPLKVFYFKLSCRMIVSLAYRSDKRPCLTLEHQQLLSESFNKAIIRLKSHLEDNSAYENFFEAFESEWKKVEKFENKLQNSVYILRKDTSVNLEYRDPVDNIEKMHCDMQRFFSLWSVKLSLTNDKNLLPLSIYPIYYLSSSFIWELNKTYKNKDKNFVRCTVKYNKSEEVLYYISDPEFALLVASDVKYKDCFVVKVVENLLNVEIVPDRADPRKLVLFVRNRAETVEIGFADPQRCLWTYKDLENSQKTCKEQYVTVFNQLVDQLTCNN
jgi:hypothetical protein